MDNTDWWLKFFIKVPFFLTICFVEDPFREIIDFFTGPVKETAEVVIKPFKDGAEGLVEVVREAPGSVALSVVWLTAVMVFLFKFG